MPWEEPEDGSAPGAAATLADRRSRCPAGGLNWWVASPPGERRDAGVRHLLGSGRAALPRCCVVRASGCVPAAGPRHRHPVEQRPHDPHRARPRRRPPAVLRPRADADRRARTGAADRPLQLPGGGALQARRRPAARSGPHARADRPRATSAPPGVARSTRSSKGSTRRSGTAPLGLWFELQPGPAAGAAPPGRPHGRRAAGAARARRPLAAHRHLVARLRAGDRAARLRRPAGAPAPRAAPAAHRRRRAARDRHLAAARPRPQRRALVAARRGAARADRARHRRQGADAAAARRAPGDPGDRRGARRGGPRAEARSSPTATRRPRRPCRSRSC